MAAFASTSPSPAISASAWRMDSLRAALPALRPSPSAAVRPRRQAASVAPFLRSSFVSTSSASSSVSPAQISSAASASLDFSYTSSFSVESSFAQRLFGIDVRGRILAMRHGKRIPRLGRPADQRKALLRGLTTQLLKHGRIKTTKPRAKAMRKQVRGKKRRLHKDHPDISKAGRQCTHGLHRACLENHPLVAVHPSALFKPGVCKLPFELLFSYVIL
ncbi:hypothetical protein ZWY2020_018573 [Hordeum vulgare]|nr:hypothetical protein ZWY2020_018573 [Hordeum vulgare]